MIFATPVALSASRRCRFFVPKILKNVNFCIIEIVLPPKPRHHFDENADENVAPVQAPAPFWGVGCEGGSARIVAALDSESEFPRPLSHSLRLGGVKL